MADDNGLTVLDAFFRVGLPRDTVLPVESGLLYQDAKSVWPSLLYSYRSLIAQRNQAHSDLQHLRDLLEKRDRQLNDQQQLYVELYDELEAARNFRCRKRLQPLVKMLVKPSAW